ncbi:MAG: efflux RND transporter permease subunit [Candidatus Paceibacteria bacterium]
MIRAIVKSILSRPFFIYSFLALAIFLGINAFFKIDRKLFPNSNRPQIAVVITQSASSAKDMATNIAIIVEEELYTLENIRRVYSSTIDEVCVINAEFDYEKTINDASSDVQNSINKIRSKLPVDINEPQIHKITAATAPIITIGVSSQNISMIDIRELIQNNIKKEFLKLEGVANVDIFGGFKKEIQVILDKHKIDSLNLGFSNIIQTIQNHNKDYAIGSMENETNKILIKSTNQKDSLKDLSMLEISKGVYLKDIASINFTNYTNSASYNGNGKNSIAIAIQRNLSADVISTIKNVEKELQKIQKQYPELNFGITDTQKTTIEQSTSNMFESLRDAIIMSMIVVFIFLASLRQIFVVLLTIPIVYISTIALMWIFGIEFNIITLTGIILALGLLLDDTVVVVENIQRHYENLDKEMQDAVEDGTTEIMFADFSGTLTTMVALLPILFVGDYPQTVFGPLISTLLLALFASYVISITFVPLISIKILKIQTPWIIFIEKKFQIISDSINDFFVNFFTQSLNLALKSKLIATGYFVALFALFIISAKIVMPLVGQELMPAMDTGAVKIKITTTQNLSIDYSKKILKEVEKIVYKYGKIETVSSSIGSEAGVLSIGSGGEINDILVIATYINRFERTETIWDIQEKLRKEIATIKDIKSLEISDAGATAMASIKANIDVTLYGDDFETLYNKALEYEKAMYKTKGIVTVGKTWHLDNATYDLKIDTKKAFEFGLSHKDIVTQLQQILKGVSISSFKVKNNLDIPIRIWVENKSIDSISKIQNLALVTEKGLIPLNSVAKVIMIKQPNIISRENLFYTIDILGFRKDQSISQIMTNFEEEAKDIILPSNIKMKHTGDIEQFQDSSIRIIKSVAIGLVLIFLVMIPMFESLKIPLIIIFSIPLTIAGASWILLLLDYHSSMSAMIGFVLLAGVIVNNAILLIHFALGRLQENVTSKEAMIESIKLRTRPVLMTAISVSVGMIPVAMGWAIGLERLAPLGAVVIGGLVVGTFLTLFFIPLIFIWSIKGK